MGSDVVTQVQSGLPEHPERDAESRRLHFEARKFTLETLTKLYISQMEEARIYLLGHLRLTFGLAVGALAGFLTLVGAFARFADRMPVWPRDWFEMTLLGTGICLMVTASFVALAQSRAAADRATRPLFDPYAGEEATIRSILAGDPADEAAFLDALSRVLSRQGERPERPSTALVQSLVLLGIAMGGTGFILL